MARIRTIKPSIFSSRSVSTYTDAQFRIFVGLFCYADDSGRGEDDVDLIKAELAPRIKRITTRQIEAHLAHFADKSADPDNRPPICRYEVNGLRCFHFTTWAHQRINRPTLSKLPPCPRHEPEGLFE
jgi:hypothetical protein